MAQVVLVDLPWHQSGEPHGSVQICQPAVLYLTAGTATPQTRGLAPLRRKTGGRGASCNDAAAAAARRAEQGSADTGAGGCVVKSSAGGAPAQVRQWEAGGAANSWSGVDAPAWRRRCRCVWRSGLPRPPVAPSEAQKGSRGDSPAPVPIASQVATLPKRKKWAASGLPAPPPRRRLQVKAPPRAPRAWGWPQQRRGRQRRQRPWPVAYHL